MDTAAVATSETNLRILDFELCLSNVKLKGISYVLASIMAADWSVCWILHFWNFRFQAWEAKSVR
jgi:hypothetical protein